MSLSGFYTEIFYTVRVHPNGNLYFNDTPIVQNGVFSGPADHFANYASGINPGSASRRVLLSIGGGSGASDFANIKTLFCTEHGTNKLLNNFAALQKHIPVDGFDFILEEKPLEDYRQTVVSLAILLTVRMNVYITFSPRITTI
jgi:hypothetical protein